MDLNDIPLSPTGIENRPPKQHKGKEFAPVPRYSDSQKEPRFLIKSKSPPRRKSSSSKKHKKKAPLVEHSQNYRQDSDKGALESARERGKRKRRERKSTPDGIRKNMAPADTKKIKDLRQEVKDLKQENGRLVEANKALTVALAAKVNRNSTGKEGADPEVERRLRAMVNLQTFANLKFISGDTELDTVTHALLTKFDGYKEIMDQPKQKARTCSVLSPNCPVFSV